MNCGIAAGFFFQNNENGNYGYDMIRISDVQTYTDGGLFEMKSVVR